LNKALLKFFSRVVKTFFTKTQYEKATRLNRLFTFNAENYDSAALHQKLDILSSFGAKSIEAEARAAARAQKFSENAPLLPRGFPPFNTFGARLKKRF